jgi:hypothetical protein
MSDGPPAEVAAPFEDRHRLPGTREINRSGKTSQSAADDDHILAHEPAMVAHFAHRTGCMAECLTGSGPQLFMRRIYVAAIVCLIAAAAPLRAGSVNDFYAALLKRGVEHVNSGSYEAGAGELKLAAFGLLNSVELYQTAQIYLTIANQHLDHEPQTRAAATRVVAAERIEPHYAKLTLPDKVRKEFESIAQKVLPASQYEVLHPPKP